MQHTILTQTFDLAIHKAAMHKHDSVTAVAKIKENICERAQISSNMLGRMVNSNTEMTVSVLKCITDVVNECLPKSQHYKMEDFLC